MDKEALCLHISKAVDLMRVQSSCALAAWHITLTQGVAGGCIIKSEEDWVLQLNGCSAAAEALPRQEQASLQKTGKRWQLLSCQTSS